MKIKSITTNFVSTAPAIYQFLQPEYNDFRPHWECVIESDLGTFRGTGETQEEAKTVAHEGLKSAADADAAIAGYYRTNSMGFQP